ncbi:MAG: hypothetical protein EON54_09495 [Alcaligenaceae bacterium]|nr:MAG: hypothetical protein EON54_09495 [Alcaligenaceae bacterium]
MNLSLITHLVVAVVAAAGVWIFQDARWEADVADMRYAAADNQLQAVAKARTTERAVNNTYQEALNAARTREALLRTELDHLHRVSDGLRDQSAEAARRLAAAPPAAVLEYAAALGVVFNDCRAAYAAMVAKADGHATDVVTLKNAWPSISQK